MKSLGQELKDRLLELPEIAHTTNPILTIYVKTPITDELIEKIKTIVGEYSFNVIGNGEMRKF